MPEDRAVRLLLVLTIGIVVGFVAAFALWLTVGPIPADAADVGLFTTSSTGSRTNCEAITGPISGQTWCFEQATGQMRVYFNGAWATVSLNNQAPISYTIGGQSNRVNDYIVYAASATGSNQHVGMFLDMTATNTLSAGFFRIPLGVRVQTGGAGGTADGIIGLNIIAQQNSADSIAFVNGLELSFNNNKRNDPLNPTDQNHFGMTLDAYGGFTTGPAALGIRTAATNSTWQRGVYITASTINANGYAFDYEGNNTDGAVRITNDANIQVASGVSFNATQVLFNGSFKARTPLCTNNCGTSPSVVGTNSAMRITMGSTGTPRSPFLVLFNGTWNAAPSCIAQLDTATATGSVTVTNTSATGFQVNTGTSPAQGVVYNVHCLGVG